VASPPPATHGFVVDSRQTLAVTHSTPGPYPPDLSGALVTRLQPLVHFRYAAGLASRTRTVWQYRHVPAFSGLLPTLAGTPGSNCTSSNQPLQRPKQRSLIPFDNPAPRDAHSTLLHSRASRRSGGPAVRAFPQAAGVTADRLRCRGRRVRILLGAIRTTRRNQL
jgi:hypothetical protein